MKALNVLKSRSFPLAAVILFSLATVILAQDAGVDETLPSQSEVQESKSAVEFSQPHFDEASLSTIRGLSSAMLFELDRRFETGDDATSRILDLTHQSMKTLGETGYELIDEEQQIESCLARLTKLHQIINSAAVSNDPEFKRELPILARQFQKQLDETIVTISIRSGRRNEAAAKRPMKDYELWKSDIQTILQSFKASTQDKDWDQCLRLAEKMIAVSNEKIDDAAMKYLSRGKQYQITSGRERIALWAEIAGEYAAEHDEPHALYFHDKMQNFLADMP